MRWLRLVCVILAMGAPAAALAGDVQVLCEPGLRVYLDGVLAGTSSAKDDGLFLANVAGGSHVIRVEKDGFVAQSFQVEVTALPVEVKVETFSPEVPAQSESKAESAPAKEALGDIVVTSAPQNCVVEIDGKGRDKTVPFLLIEDIAAGEHRISFSKPGYQAVSGVIRTYPGVKVTIRGDLATGKVETIYEGKGSLRVFTTPEFCTVEFRGKFIDKTRERLNLSDIPAGEYEIAVYWLNLRVAKKILITNGQRTVVTVSFMKGDKPIVVSSEPE
jgi:hypothetical protein